MTPDEIGRLSGVARTLGILFLIFLGFYLLEFVQLPLSIDDEIAALRTEPTAWLGQGRWTTFIVEALFLRQPVITVIPIAVFGLTMAAAYMVYLDALGKPPGFTEYLLFPLFSAFPTWFFLTEFQANTPSEGIGVLAACGAVHLFAGATRDPGRLLLTRALVLRLGGAAVLGAVAIGAYQANLIVMAVLAAGVVAFRTIADRDRTLRSAVRDLIVAAIAIGLAAALYFAVLALFRAALDVPAGYIENFVRFDRIIAEPGRVVSIALRELFRVYSGSASVYGNLSFAFGGIVVAGFLALLLHPALSDRLPVRLLLLVLLAAILVMPFAFNLMAGGGIAYRVLVAVPAAVWICGYLAMTTPLRWLQRASFVVLVVALCQILFVANQLQVRGILVRQHDALVVGALYDRIAQSVPDFDRAASRKLAVYGGYRFRTPYPRVDSSTAGASFFEWDGGNAGRIAALMRLLGFEAIRAATDEEEMALLPVAEKMPVWPATGSVAIVGDTIVVRLGKVIPVAP